MSFRPSATRLKGLAPSSQAWLSRHYRDPYVKQRLSHPDNYRSRSAFKLLELDDRWGRWLTKRDVNAVVDLGAAPGGWSQVVAGKMGWTERDVIQRSASPNGPPTAKRKSAGTGLGPKESVKMEQSGSWSSFGGEQADSASAEAAADDPAAAGPKGRGTVIAVDILPMRRIPGVQTLQTDFLSPKAATLIAAMLATPSNPDGKADIVLSDIAENFSGNGIRDSASSLEVCSAVFQFAARHLRTAQDIGRPRGGVLLLKHFMHPLLQQFRKEKLEPNFKDVKFIKPDASRAGSSEGYWLCQGWKGIHDP
ncbi:hypothetical protein PLICRDRAFT_45538 [Plicaturopsis crispa FD-325 SS-3]|uniref:rRNA methyltransferase 2, mitochondrial n=1 Tax=Plicaturopsis crispa FD-325 SS-3 TaxID=944288 RepID=A0A0C9SL22_PLICR|nr:hypothetical protein PLICRDRAFT_45538 [Plicaturopsis crispa FD-325 SS-3]